MQIVWHGGETTTEDIPLAIGVFAALSMATEMEEQILAWAWEGQADRDSAAAFTAQGIAPRGTRSCWQAPSAISDSNTAC